MLVMPATNAVSERSFSAFKASQDLPAFNHGRPQAQPPHASACPQGIGRWYCNELDVVIARAKVRELNV